MPLKCSVISGTPESNIFSIFFRNHSNNQYSDRHMVVTGNGGVDPTILLIAFLYIPYEFNFKHIVVNFE
ncbi:hypothetical protein DASC09_035910 [Saccharomycopsis crataegensis]|uniref:Uncharacterized protein n=1 Tax=Saccharomycopsis crataegensis TaxID=43959 RepID=A0AAV5QNH9_9ASCO|nr:hypothetical protein DASC09_035910 [Saccharomycopsis crataegensis]